MEGHGNFGQVRVHYVTRIHWTGAVCFFPISHAVGRSS